MLSRVNLTAFVLLTFVFILVSCSDGSDGKPGAAGAPGSTISSTATALTITVNSVSVGTALTVNFTVTNENGDRFKGIGDADLRFNVAKLTPGSNGDPSSWQNYIVRSSGGAMQGSQERNRSGYPWGTFVNNGDGTYSYTFATDIKNVSCPSPCTTADGKPLDLSYQAGLTTRIGIQQSNSSLPMANAIYDFVPDGSAVTTTREIIKTANCNVCHDKITAHGSRFEVKLCVTCHNPGSWVKGTNGNTTVDFKVMIHRIHRGADLPSVQAGGTYAVGNHDFSDIVFPQDIRNCTKCHDGSDPDTPQGNNWQIPNMAACGSCHDDIDFSKDGSGSPPINPTGHPGGIVTDNSECVTCHAENRIAGSVAKSHTIPGKVARAYFKFNILKICGTAVGANPVCAPSSKPTVTFSVTDPSGATTHQYGNAYNISSTGSDPEFTSSASSLNLLIAWDTRDYTNDGGTGTRPSRADSVNLRTSTAVSDNGDGTFTLNGTTVTPTAEIIPASATGSGAIAIEGHPAADDGTGAFTVEVPVNSEVSYFGITDTTPKPRRVVIDVATKCDRCHDILSVHGSNRNNNGQLCVMCHNSSDTDVSQRPKNSVGLPDDSVTKDHKKEESIDFKRLIHGIHAAAASNFDGTDAHGFRQQGLVVYGYGGNPHDFSSLRFPGVLSKCETCHLPDTYTLADRSDSGGANWEMPAANGVKGSTVDSAPNAALDGSDFTAKLIDQSDDYKYSPIASVCSSCHDGILPQQHMMNNGAIFGGPGSDQASQEANIESCPVCHGPGKLADVKLVHDQAFADFLGEFIP